MSDTTDVPNEDQRAKRLLLSMEDRLAGRVSAEQKDATENLLIRFKALVASANSGRTFVAHESATSLELTVSTKKGPQLRYIKLRQGTLVVATTHGGPGSKIDLDYDVERSAWVGPVDLAVEPVPGMLKPTVPPLVVICRDLGAALLEPESQAPSARPPDGI